MNIIVQKYNDSFIKENKNKVIENIIRYNKKNKLIILISSEERKNNLINLANNYIKEKSSRELDMLISTAEIQSVSLLSMILNEKGYKSIALTAEQAGIISNSNFGNSKIESIYTENILNYLNNNYIVIIPSSQAIDRLGNITTLDNDLTAVLIASYLKAKKCEIYTNLDNIKIIKNNNITYNEVKELNLPITIKDLNKTIRIKESLLNKNDISFIVKKDNLTKIKIIGNNLISNQYILTNTIKISNNLKIPIYMISLSENTINILVDTNKSTTLINKLNNFLIEKESTKD